MKHLIFVVETNKKIQSDNRYIVKLIKSKYKIDKNETKISFLFMDGKGNYKSKKILSDIKDIKKQNLNGTIFIIYCFDTDKIQADPSERNIFEEELKFCENNNYYLIWFNLNIEHVLLKKNVEKKNKQKEAIKFFKKTVIDIEPENLYGNDYNLTGKSNIYYILDSLL